MTDQELLRTLLRVLDLLTVTASPTAPATVVAVDHCDNDPSALLVATRDGRTLRVSVEEVEGP